MGGEEKEFLSMKGTNFWNNKGERENLFFFSFSLFFYRIRTNKQPRTWFLLPKKKRIFFFPLKSPKTFFFSNQKKQKNFLPLKKKSENLPNSEREQRKILFSGSKTLCNF
jgi:hypothetical protein